MPNPYNLPQFTGDIIVNGGSNTATLQNTSNVSSIIYASAPPLLALTRYTPSSIVQYGSFTASVANVVVNGTTTASVASGGFPGAQIGMTITGGDIGAGTTVVSISGNTLIMSQAATGSGTVSINFIALTFCPIDPVNLTISVPFPPSGRVLIKLEALTLQNTVSVPGFWGLLLHNTLTMAGDSGGCVVNGTANNWRTQPLTIVVSGTPGSTVQYDWAWATPAGDMKISAQLMNNSQLANTAGPVTMEAWAA